MPFILSIRNFPRKVKITDVKKFFDGIKFNFIKLDNHGRGHIEVKNEEDLNKALLKDSIKYKDRAISVSLKVAEQDVNDKKKKIKQRPQFPTEDIESIIEKIEDTGRLYIRNLSYDATESDVVELFKQYGDLAEVSLPYDYNLKRTKAFGFVTFLLPKDAVNAFKNLDKTEFKGRKIHILSGEEKPEGQKCKGVLENNDTEDKSTFKDKKMDEMKAKASSGHNWNALFVNSDVVAQYLADKLGISKSELFNGALKGSVSVKMAQAETELVGSIQKFILDNHIRLDMLDKITNRGVKSKGDVNVAFSLSSVTFIVKNLSPGVTRADLEEVFSQYKGLRNILLPPYGVTAIVTYELSQQAKVAYLNCAYMEFKDSVMMLQWAPLDLFDESVKDTVNEEQQLAPQDEKESKKKSRKRELEKGESTDNNAKLKKAKIDSELPVVEIVEKPIDKNRTRKILVKNIPFQATQSELEELFRPFDGIASIRLPKKPSGGHKGFGFVEFDSEEQAQVLMDSMGISTHLLGRRLILLYSNTE